MISIDNLSNDAFQSTTIVLSDGTKVIINLNFLPAIQRWSLDVGYGDFNANGLMLTIHPNLLREWKNVIPFGLSCTTIDGADPFAVSDFSSKRSTLYVLDTSDVTYVEAQI